MGSLSIVSTEIHWSQQTAQSTIVRNSSRRTCTTAFQGHKMRAMEITPRKQHRFVEELCRGIAPNGAPRYVPVRTELGARPNECFFNVPQKIAKDGGTPQHGWCLWELPGLFIEAELHAVWVSPSGEWVDVTPKSNREDKILFLPDDTVTFDETSRFRRDNIRLAMKDDPTVHAFIEAAEKCAQYMEESTDPNDPRKMIMDRNRWEQLEKRKVDLQLKMESLPVSRNDLCRCGSGEKYKKCCG